MNGKGVSIMDRVSKIIIIIGVVIITIAGSLLFFSTTSEAEDEIRYLDGKLYSRVYAMEENHIKGDLRNIQRFGKDAQDKGFIADGYYWLPLGSWRPFDVYKYLQWVTPREQQFTADESITKVTKAEPSTTVEPTATPEPTSTPKPTAKPKPTKKPFPTTESIEEDDEDDDIYFGDEDDEDTCPYCGYGHGEHQKNCGREYGSDFVVE